MNLKKYKRKWIIGILIFVLFIIAIIYIRINASDKSIHVRVVPVQHGELISSISAVGIIKPSEGLASVI